MNSETAHAQARAIFEMLDESNPGDSWSIRFHEEDELWLHDIAAHLTFLVGDSEVLYASGQLSDENGPVGRLSIITTDAIVQLSFSEPTPAPYQRVTVVDSVIARSRARLLSVDQVSGLPASERVDTFPTSLRITIELEDGAKLTLPHGRFPSRGDNATRLAEVARALVIGQAELS